MTARILHKGEPVRVRAAGTDDEWMNALVVLSSENGRSVALALQGMVRAGAGHMAYVGNFLPLSVDYERETVTSPMGDEYELEVMEK